ncbi:MAG: hypothetical protein IPI46_06585 [Bacteroidetes bacterium]|nr:hypothetical protein [Bacteroidota bacterium]
MKKIISFTLIVFSLCILVNCSPKTAGKAASSESAKKSNADKTAQDAKVAVVEPIKQEVAVIEEVKPNPIPGVADIASLPNDRQMALYSDMAPMRVEMGKRICTAKCAKCHDKPEPSAKNASGWIDIMKTMGKQAKLNTDEYLMVAAYLVQNAKK